MTVQMDSKVVVFDVDGTLLNIEHRRGFVASKPKNWKAFNAAMVDDSPYEDIIWMNNVFYDQGCRIVICSGRGDDNRDVTIDSLSKYGAKFHNVLMRGAKDFRADNLVKLDLLQFIRDVWGNPFLWIDDRNQVVDAIRDAGVRVLQVAPGDF